MATRQELIQDLKNVDKEIDSTVTPSVYDYLGDFSFEDIITEFGNWDIALDEAGVSLKKKLIKDIIKTSKKFDGSISLDDYRKKGNYSYSDIIKEFDTWNKLKKAAGLEINQRKIPLEKIKEDMKNVAAKLDRPLTYNDYNKYGKFSVGVFYQRDITFGELRDKIGLEKPKGNASKEALEAWKEELKEVRGRFKYQELKEKLDKTGHKLNSIGIANLKEYLTENGFQITRSLGGTKAKYYIKGPEAETINEYYEKFLKKIPEDKEKWFKELSGTGKSPKSIVAAIRYLTENKTQREIANEEGISEVSLRNVKECIIEKFNLDKKAGINKIY